MVMQRVVCITLGYEDLNDHDDLRLDPVLAVLASKLTAQRSDCAPLAGKSTLNRLELSRAEPTRYHKVSQDPAAIESLLVDLFLETHKKRPRQIILDLDATNDPLHGNQEGKFFHAYYDCYCYLPLCISCGRHLLVANLRRADRDARGWGGRRSRSDRGTNPPPLAEDPQSAARRFRLYPRSSDSVVRTQPRGPRVRPGPQRPPGEDDHPRADHGDDREHPNRQVGRCFNGFIYMTLDSWSRERRVIGNAEVTGGEANSRFIVSLLQRSDVSARHLYEKNYCARGDTENCIKECQLDRFADRTSTATMQANQLRLWFASMAFVLLCGLRRIGLAHTQFAEATCGTIRLKLLKLGALVRVSVRRIKIAMASACPWQDEFELAHARLRNAVA